MYEYSLSVSKTSNTSCVVECIRQKIHFSAGVLAGEQNVRYMAERTAATTAAAYNAHSV